MEEQPRHKHHLTASKFLGSWDTFDLYYDNNQNLLIARYGSNVADFSAQPPEYMEKRRGTNAPDGRALLVAHNRWLNASKTKETEIG